ncbi:MAG TPA: SDR family oxidoreductase [Catalimonadaceae bacterium]|nr:SDR family oxidoreductase [Catalimonadaceae bacterium]HPI10931.1 SDR family oxidoreductase [Catalimonadaceae bacterium]
MFELKGKTAVVTGGGSGIGKAISEKLAAQGALVFILDVQKGSTASAADWNSEHAPIFISCDVSSPDSVTDAFEQIELKSDRLDILVNNAGISHIGNIEKTSVEDFERLFNVNAKGTFLTMKTALPLMTESGGGSVVNIASTAAMAGVADRFAFSMSKAAVVGMTLSFARDYIDRNIRCNCISPGRVHTPDVDQFLSRTYPGKEAEMFESLSKAQPIGRMGTVEDIASLVLYLVSDEAAYITGSNYNIDGGFMSVRM